MTPLAQENLAREYRAFDALHPQLRAIVAASPVNISAARAQRIVSGLSLQEARAELTLFISEVAAQACLYTHPGGHPQARTLRAWTPADNQARKRGRPS